MDKEHELRRSKRNALGLLLTAAALFVVTLFLPPNFWILGLKAIAEAAMVGALADWFAVVALFRRVPVPFIAGHTAIIPKNKDKIADNLAIFVQEKFLAPESIVELIRKHDPARMISDWLNAPDNAPRFAHYLVKMMRGFLEFTDDQRIAQLIKRALFRVIDKIDLSQSVATILESLTKDGRHQALLDQAMDQLEALLAKESTRSFISTQIVNWMKREHPLTAKLLPTGWLGRNGADMVSNAVNSVLDDMGNDQSHAFRKGFDRSVQKFIWTLQNDPAAAQKAEEIKQYLKNDEKLNDYVMQLWSDMRGWLKEDLDSPNSRVRLKIIESGQWLGQALEQDEKLRASLNLQMETVAARMAPDFAEFLTRHISDTVKSWDARDMSRQIELNIGKDLQFIRINGTLVGAFIGLILYLLSQLPVVMPWVLARL
ncbi:MAG: DUF445 family protein [Ewingella americana]|jgi:uncharacterized membrane-anchored protein YjiN (DUF445 family)|uniref:DUF445 domain-containing protein n=1 Tax=Ewingella americana TaxID=41202 RepID=UPI0024319C76|nr:DUF445 family protein [Ewingella americana]MCI1680364.1 DUF445 family protein [Ewingella americana]MCI1854515.1 DUF445 family protein [Ewingella americana]MCI1860710.1 DUF445 family protein [Ewingella americana]MCI2143886.1 DUF445 family protein [Ewingella americana]MCI2164224.1 DUF445 family protein [Ewingella americana]